MANPAPTINQINAFNATQGTTIDFNIIGGTELVRSNRIYIYDLSDNSLICTHLYVSTESIHELPANTDSSIVYESGKSSADFVNGAQYYAQIQTFTDTAGTQGGSGLSVAKMFWCLVDPTLTITTIPSTISTTSYNVSATYTDTSASVVSNIIQQYQFNLYSAVGSLLQSSGVVVGSGTQQGTSTTYDISYNFSGLSVGSSYYVVVDVTTTQGMSVSAQSNTFTVSIDTPTLGEATVVNNACDGYISVTSNLSSEYGGSGSGEIVSFETDSENVFTKLQVDLDPIQDLHGYDAPWVGGAGKNKASLTNPELTSKTSQTIATLNQTGTYTYTVSFDLTNVTYQYISSGLFNFIANGSNNYKTPGLIKRVSDNVAMNNITQPITGRFYTTFESLVNPTKLDVMFMSASYGIYTGTMSNVQLEVGSTPTSFAPYSNICPISGHDEVDVARTGKNLLDTSLFNDGSYYTTNADGSIKVLASDSRAWDIDRSITLPAGNYTFSRSNTSGNCQVRDLTNNVAVGFMANGTSSTTFTLSSTVQIGVRLGTSAGSYPLTGKYQIELGSTATTYEPYNGQTYTADLPQTVYGGTVDLATGEIVIDRAMVLIKNLTWARNTTSYPTTPYFYTTISNGIGGEAKQPLLLSSAYRTGSNLYERADGVITNANYHVANTLEINVFDSQHASVSLSNFLAEMGDEQIVYPLATPQTFQLTPQEIQTLLGVNNVWSEDGDVEITYNIPITNLLVKRQDVVDVSGTWLTLYSQPVTQASDMDFTFIDFLNQYGKTYKYALVPLLTQQQSGVEVEVEGGYTVSDEVQSVFDGVFIADQTGSQKCKANVGYGNVDMNQTVGTITPIGAKYPVVITNSKNQYHNGSISGTIVPDDYYFNGNLSRIDMVNKRDELEQFLTNKRAKIIKDWNGKIWLVMIMDNVSCTFNNNYGMGIVNFSTSWVEVGDPTNQQDLQATGLINVGGV